MRTTRSAIVLVLVAVLALSAEAAPSREQVETVVARAQGLAADGDWSGSYRLLDRTFAECSPRPAGLDCRPLIAYTRAYLAEQQARREPERRSDLLDEAVNWYRQVLRDVPAHRPTLENLVAVYRTLGAFEEAFAVLERAAEESPQSRDAYAIALGDLFATEGRWQEALAAYERAAALNSGVAAKRIVEVYRQAKLDLASLAERLPGWEAVFPEAAEQGYRLLITRLPEDDTAGPEAERHLLSWTSLAARQNSMTPERVDAISRAWPAMPMVELRGYLADPGYLPGWWREGLQRRQKLTEVAIAVGQREVARKQPDVAARRWSTALREFAPRGYHYYDQLKGQRNARLDLQTELAALYHQYPRLDQGDAFQRLIWDIFKSKAEAYAADDLVAVQRHHTVLGTIFLQDEGLESRGHRAVNAVFQLHHAIRAAERRFERGEPYQPVPRLREMLAGACAKPSPIVRQEALQYCRDEDGESTLARLYLEAAKAYLDTDQLEKAAEMISLAENIGIPSGMEELRRAVTRVLAGRKAVAGITAGEITGDEAPPWMLSEDYRWIAAPTATQADEFVQRQQFKALTDYTAKVLPLVDDSEAAVKFAKTTSLLEAASKGLVLAGTSDELRVERIAALGIRYASAEDCPAPGGEDVMWVQRALMKLIEPGLEVDGIYGPATRQAIETFQSSYGLAVDGRAGKDTKAKIHQLLCE